MLLTDGDESKNDEDSRDGKTLIIVVRRVVKCHHYVDETKWQMQKLYSERLKVEFTLSKSCLVKKAIIIGRMRRMENSGSG